MEKTQEQCEAKPTPYVHVVELLRREIRTPYDLAKLQQATMRELMEGHISEHRAGVLARFCEGLANSFYLQQCERLIAKERLQSAGANVPTLDPVVGAFLAAMDRFSGRQTTPPTPSSNGEAKPFHNGQNRYASQDERLRRREIELLNELANIRYALQAAEKANETACTAS